MRLYSGYEVSAEINSYAYISLDTTKAIKLDASSAGEVMKSGNMLEMKLTAGSMFFDVTAPVQNSERMTIRTSTMVTGIRGTAGWVEIIDRYTTRVTLLEGELHITSTHPLTGEDREISLLGGQTATVVFHGEERDYDVDIILEEKTIQELIQDGVIHDEHIIHNATGLTVEELQEEDVPGFVAVEVKQSEALQEKIEETTGLSVPEIVEDAEERLAEEELVAEEEGQQIQEALEKIGADNVDPIFEEEEKDSGSSAPAPSVPATTAELDDPTPAELADVLADPNIKTISLANVGVSNGGVLNNATVRADQTLNLNSGTLPASGTTTVNGTVNVASGAILQNNGTMNVASTNSIHVSGTMTNNGTLNIGTSAASGLVEVKSGGALTNNGTLENAAAGVIRYGLDENQSPNGTLTNNSTMTNAGDFSVDEVGFFVNSGTYKENRGDQLYNIAQKGDDVYYLGSMNGLDTIGAAYDGCTVTLIGTLDAGTVVKNLVIGNTEVTMDLNGKQVTYDKGIYYSGGSLTVESGADPTVKNGTLKSAHTASINVLSGATLTLEQVEIPHDQNIYAINTNNGSELNLVKTTIRSASDGIYARKTSVNMSEGSEIIAGNYGILFTSSSSGGVLEDSTITSTGSTAIYFPSADSTFVLDGTASPYAFLNAYDQSLWCSVHSRQRMPEDMTASESLDGQVGVALSPPFNNAVTLDTEKIADFETALEGVLGTYGDSAVDTVNIVGTATIEYENPLVIPQRLTINVRQGIVFETAALADDYSVRVEGTLNLEGTMVNNGLFGIVSGAEINTIGTGTLLSNGTIEITTGDGSLTAAVHKDADGYITYYRDLAEATSFSAGTVLLGGAPYNGSLPEWSTANKTLTLDLNGLDIGVEETLAVSNSATLIVQDSTVGDGWPYGWSNLYANGIDTISVTGGATLQLNGGVVWNGPENGDVTIPVRADESSTVVAADAQLRDDEIFGV